ncbi:MAG TPA: methyltransferase domain-containing protein [Anaerovoracaceae bacterium]|nr:methyltransferase domain-containing protein [Anaerovoracaceae bacterium]
MKENESHELMVCPICKNKLVELSKEKTYQCMNNHNFDIAKQGYVNLLINNQKKSKLPGDSKEMVQARARFLSKGYYDTLSGRINECVIKQLEAINSNYNNILDIGCGSGYYTNKLMKSTQERNISAFYFGLDISKEAVKCASASNKFITWMVANSFYLPFKEDSFHCLLSVFSPVKIEECTRIMKNNGIFIRVLPGVNHLIQIRDIIYDTVILNEDKDSIDEYEGLKLIDMSKVCFDISVGKEDILSLVQMTPHYWKTSQLNKEPLYEMKMLTVTIDMQILIYEKC